MRTILITAMVLICFSCKTETEISKIEKYIVLEKYKEAIRECEQVLYADSNRYNEVVRNIAGDYLLLCLLKTGNLNNTYYCYRSNIKEMFFPIPTQSILAGACFQFECGIPLSSYEINRILIKGENNNSPVFWRLFEENSIINNRINHYKSVRNFMGRQASAEQFAGQRDTSRIIYQWKQKTETMPPDTIVKINAMDMLGNIVSMFPVYGKNREILEAYTAIALFEGWLDHLPRIAERHKKTGNVRLPDYVQEAVIIASQNNNIQNYYGFEIENKIKNRYINFIRAINNIYTGAETLQSVKKKFGDTYFYYYFTLILESGQS